MRGVYRIVDTILGVTTAKTLLYFSTPSAMCVEILRASITCQDEDTSEQIMAELNRVSGAGHGTGTAITPKPTEEGSAASSLTNVKSNCTVEPTAYDGESDAIASGGANKLAGWEYVPLPEERVTIKPSDNVGLRLIDAIANSSDLTVEIFVREIG